MYQDLVWSNPIVDNFPVNTPPETIRQVESVLHKAHETLRELLDQRTEVTRRIGTVRRTILGLAGLLGDQALPDDLTLRDLDLTDRAVHRRKRGLTEACRTVLMKATGPISAREVRDRIEQTAPSILSGHKHPLAAVTTVLGRLAQYEEARIVISDRGDRTWKWSVDEAADFEQKYPVAEQR